MVRYRDTIVYWARLSPNGEGGYIYSDAVEISGRWEDLQKVYKTPTGKEAVSEAVAYLESDIVPGGYLMQGTLDDVTVLAIPESTARIVRAFEKIPNIKITKYIRTAYLGKKSS